MSSKHQEQPLSIVFEDQDLIVINKGVGILSQRDKSGLPDAADLTKEELRISSGDFLAPVHRLDRNTSGLLVLARNKGSAAKLSKMVKSGDIKRTYLAVVKGTTEKSGVISENLLKDGSTNKSFVSPQGKPAVTNFVRKELFPSTSLLEINLDTGRSHQIRVHFSHFGHPLIGDKKYGKKPWSELFGRPALHAIALRFPHPKKPGLLEFKAPLPNDFSELVLSLKG